ncbi:MAG: thrombospondin type 3 repeat-containing protein [Acidobacteria bacterium]|nr:thrombospondin type 3 repeat-containing protein [Acidobacteriota bacterium]
MRATTRKNNLAWFWIVLAGLMLLAAPGMAGAGGGQAGDFEIGVYAGNGFMDDYEFNSGPISGFTSLNPDDDLLYGLRIGYFITDRWSVEGVFQQFSGETGLSSGSNLDFDIDSFRVDALLNFKPGSRFRPYLAGGVGADNTSVDAVLDPTDLSLNLGGGVRWFMGTSFGLRLDARYVSTDVRGVVDNRQSNVEASLGILFAFGGGPPPDADGDGVKDSADRCPGTPRGAVVDAKGCPDDTDNDGVFNGIDQCPDTPQGATVDAAGCPTDTDGDGVPDGIDQCPDTPSGATVNAEGCPGDTDGDGVYDGIDQCPDTPSGASVGPDGCPTDTDGDGVPDGIDRCPNTPSGATVGSDGCPTDTDGDGVYDGIDQCPETPSGATVDATGCEVLFKADQRILVLQNVNFVTNSAELTAASRSSLDTVAMGLREIDPEVRVEVGGHTDSTGSQAHNRALSLKRAEAVRDYLVSKGIDALRLTAKGYGSSVSIADNGTREGRAENRRVELKKID